MGAGIGPIDDHNAVEPHPLKNVTFLTLGAHAQRGLR